MHSLRLCARACRNASIQRRIAPTVATSRRPISYTRAWRSDNVENPTRDEAEQKIDPQTPRVSRRSDKVVLALQEDMDEAEKAQLRTLLEKADGAASRNGGRKMSSTELEEVADTLASRLEVDKLSKEESEAWADWEKTIQEFDEATGEANKVIKPNNKSFWAEDEEDPDLIAEDDEDDDFGEDDIMSLAHAKLEEHREYREYARIAAWQMPLLSKLARPFERPTTEECLRFRYTTYMGENHPAQSKVVVEFSPRDLPLDKAQQTKLRKLLGARWNPETDVAKMSCEQFDHQAQNKRYLGDLVNKLVVQAQDATDMFEDVPLDTRHHPVKAKPKFPKEWYLTEKRMQEIEDTRQKALLLDQRKEEAGSLVDGAEILDKYFKQSEFAIPETVRIPSLSSSRPPPRQRR